MAPKQPTGEIVICSFCDQVIQQEHLHILKLKNGGTTAVHRNRPGIDCVKGYRARFPNAVINDGESKGEAINICEHALVVRQRKPVPRKRKGGHLDWAAIPHSPGNPGPSGTETSRSLTTGNNSDTSTRKRGQKREGDGDHLPVGPSRGKSG